MLKRLFVSLVFICAGIYSFSAQLPKVKLTIDSLRKVLTMEDKDKRNQLVIPFIKGYLQDGDTTGLYNDKSRLILSLNTYATANKEALISFTESVYQQRHGHLDSAENALIRAIRQTDKNKDHYLQYIFLTHLAFIQTDKGDATGALYSYGLAKKEAAKVKNSKLQVIIDINMSDLYYKIGFYGQSISALSEAEEIAKTDYPNEKRYFTLIYYNKAENYFRNGNYDSLKIYNDKLKGPDNQSYKLYTYQKRTDYYLLLLKHDYKNAIVLINQLKGDKHYVKSELEDQRLAEAYYAANMLDSARNMIDTLLLKKTEINHPEIKARFYSILGEIAEKNRMQDTATYYFKLAFTQSETNLANFMKAGSIAAQIKTDEIESAYLQSESKYRRERVLLLLIIVTSLFALVIILLFYRSIKQKRHYERLLFASKKEELGFINSHEVRVHLSNIIGLIHVMKQSDPGDPEFLQARDHLLQSSEMLDVAIKNISEKLSE